MSMWHSVDIDSKVELVSVDGQILDVAYQLIGTDARVRIMFMGDDRDASAELTTEQAVLLLARLTRAIAEAMS